MGWCARNEGAANRSLSLPVRTLHRMQLSDVKFACEWCGKHFVRRHQRGRCPLYCNHTCRQRAYEARRRGACTLGLPKPTVVERLREHPKCYQAGVGGMYLHLSHALRPDGAADRIGFRPTLCGARVKPTLRPFYVNAPPSFHNCATCDWIAARFPPVRNIDPAADIGTATSLIGSLWAARHADEPELRSQVDQLLALLGAPAGAAGATRSPREAQMTSHW